LERCRFSVRLTERAPDATGGDDVRFLIAPNPGEPPKPIDEIASGGELSRIMLALEVTLAASDRTPVLVFDEVDAGVGGRVGEAVGRALWSLARHHQVMVVSHLSQVAAYADHHVAVRKEVRRGRTHVVAAPLGEREVVDELAEMLGASGARSLAAGAKKATIVSPAGPNVPFPPQEALLVEKIPEGPSWWYEPKWDGFRGVFE